MKMKSLSILLILLALTGCYGSGGGGFEPADSGHRITGEHQQQRCGGQEQ
ncbi:MAG: hypothetical protein MPW15_27945 [Candidatus Manganitrophus sp.]|nr:hypothetical protein [Candidatus Manganitrophus sp.]